MELPEITRLNPNHVPIFEMALKHLEEQFPQLHPLEFRWAYDQQAQRKGREAVEQYEIEQVNFAAKNQLD